MSGMSKSIHALPPRPPDFRWTDRRGHDTSFDNGVAPIRAATTSHLPTKSQAYSLGNWNERGRSPPSRPLNRPDHYSPPRHGSGSGMIPTRRRADSARGPRKDSPTERFFRGNSSWKRSFEDENNTNAASSWQPPGNRTGSYHSRTTSGSSFVQRARPSALGNYKLKERQKYSSTGYQSRSWDNRHYSPSRSRSNSRTRSSRTRSYSRSRSRSRSRTRSSERSTSSSRSRPREDTRSHCGPSSDCGRASPGGDSRSKRGSLKQNISRSSRRSATRRFSRRRTSSASSRTSRSDSIASSNASTKSPDSSRTPSPAPMRVEPLPPTVSPVKPPSEKLDELTPLAIPVQISESELPSAPQTANDGQIDIEMQVPGLSAIPMLEPQAMSVDIPTSDMKVVQDQSALSSPMHISTVSPERAKLETVVANTDPGLPTPPESVEAVLTETLPKETEGSLQRPIDITVTNDALHIKEMSDKVVPPTLPSPPKAVPLTPSVPPPPPAPTPRRRHLKRELVHPADNIKEALRICIAARRTDDLESREDRVDRILSANTKLVDQPHTQSQYTTEWNIINVNGQFEDRISRSNPIRKVLVTRMAQRHEELTNNHEELKETYLAKHSKWMAHCQRLDNAAKPPKPPTPSPDEIIPPARTTRRSAAMLGDTVRSDLEMEQIIASLGNDDLMDPNIMASRNLAKIPDLISANGEEKAFVYDDNNGRITDPKRFYDISASVEDWTDEERRIFVRKYALYPKQFGLISSFLEHKTARQCVLYYYIHKKELMDFRDAVARWGSGRKRKGQGRKYGRQKGNALLADIASTARSRRKPNQDMAPGNSILNDGLTRPRVKVTAQNAEMGNNPQPEPETSRSGRRKTALITRVVAEDDEGNETDKPPQKKNRGGRPRKHPAKEDEPTKSRKPIASSSWSEPEIADFARLLSMYGTNFKRISASMPNKTAVQLRNYYQHDAKLQALTVKAMAQFAPTQIAPVPMYKPPDAARFLPYLPHNLNMNMLNGPPQFSSYAQWADRASAYLLQQAHAQTQAGVTIARLPNGLPLPVANNVISTAVPRPS